ncbi:MAG: HAD family hydrolase [Proteobacteria bacterium]|nr:HAD family hydrolase [Pseudomonadota bacterium]
MSCEALIFDVDGTLADTEEVHRQAFNLAFAACGLDWIWDAPLYGELLQVTGGKERIASYIERLAMPVTQRRDLHNLIPEIHRAKTRLYKELIQVGQVRPRAGVRRLMMEAREAGIRVGLATTTSHENIEPLLAAGFGWQALKWFDAIAAGDVVARKKPAPDIYNVALKSLGIDPVNAIAVEDSAIGVASAKAAGLFTVATPSKWTLTQDFTAADLLLSSLGDPAEPLDPADEKRLGAQFLSMDRLTALHREARRGVVHGEAE